jgi:hypothetical protein
MVGSETSSVVANVLVSGVKRAEVTSASTELDKDCIGSTTSEAVGSGSSAIEVDVVSSGIWGRGSASDWVVVICAASEIVLVETSSDVETVGTNSLEAAPTEVGAEEISVLNDVAIVVPSESGELIDASTDKEGLIDASADREGIIRVGSGTSVSIMVVGLPVKVETEPSPPTMADRLSITFEEVLILGVWIIALSKILVTAPKIVELAATSTVGVESAPVSRAVDGKASEMETTSLSSGWDMAVSVGVSSSEDTDEVSIIVVSTSVLWTSVLKFELMVISIAVGEGEILVSSPARRVLPAEDDKGNDEKDNVGISVSILVIVAPTLIPADMISVWLTVGSASTGTSAEISSFVVAAALFVALGI